MLKSKLIQLMVMIFVCIAGFAGCNSAQQSNVENSGDFIPTRNVEIVIGSSPGGGSDTLTRVLSDYICEKIIDTTIIPQNLPGGLAAAALNYSLEQPADGHTLMMITSNWTISLAKKETGHQLEDIIPISAIQLDPAFLVIKSNDKRFSNIDEFLNYAKSNKVTIGGALTDSFDAVIVNDFINKTGVKNISYVPYDSTGPAVTELLGEHIDAVVGRLPSFIGQVEAEQVKLALLFSEEKVDAYPDVPTSFEKGIEVSGLLHRGYALPKGTPANIVKFWENAFKEAKTSDKYKVAYKDSELFDGYLSSVDYQKLLNAEYQLFSDYFNN